MIFLQDQTWATEFWEDDHRVNCDAHPIILTENTSQITRWKP